MPEPEETIQPNREQGQAQSEESEETSNEYEDGQSDTWIPTPKGKPPPENMGFDGGNTVGAP